MEVEIRIRNAQIQPNCEQTNIQWGTNRETNQVLDTEQMNKIGQSTNGRTGVETR